MRGGGGVILLAIDPGPVESAFVVWNGSDIGEYGKVSNAEMLSMCQDHGEACVIEMIASYGMPVGAEVFETCVWIGRFMEAFGGADRLTRIQVKSHLCHSARAKDGNVRQAVIDRLGSPGTKRSPGATYGISGDCWQALALALTWWDMHHPATVVEAFQGRPEPVREERPF